MNHEQHHHEAENHGHRDTGTGGSREAGSKQDSIWPLAVSATWHCMLGCGLGEIAGMIISTALHMSNVLSIVLSVLLGFVGGFVLGIRPWLRHGLSYAQAAKKVLIVEGLSILVMESAEVVTEVFTPGVMNAHITDSIFWVGMILSAIAGFIAALPVNYWLAGRGITHAH